MAQQMLDRHYKLIETRMQTYVATAEPMKGGWTADTRRIVLRNGKLYVGKIMSPKAVTCEAMMLDKLRPAINTPEVHIAEDDLLLLEFIEHNHQPRILHAEPGMVLMDKITKAEFITEAAEADAGRKIARLHNSMKGKYFGYDSHTLLGNIELDNEPSTNWHEFFVNKRLLPMMKKAIDAKSLTKDLSPSIEKVANNIQNYITVPKSPSLLHGDLWRGNMLYTDRSLVGLIDPAIYYGHHEVDLAMLLMFHPVGDAFFSAYSDIFPIDKDFFSKPILVYQLYGFLAHCMLYGTQYQRNIEQWLAKILGK